MTNCECKRASCPAGIWELEDLIGAEVNVGSMPISNMGAIDSTKKYKIEKIEFRISIDGKAITIVKLVGLDNYIFTLKDLIFIDKNLESKKQKREGQ